MAAERTVHAARLGALLRPVNRKPATQLDDLRARTLDRRLRAFGVQHHPEAGPGPHDARYLFDEFLADIEAARA